MDDTGRVNNDELEFVVCDTEEEIGRRCAEVIIAELRRKPSLLLCAATGSSPTHAYRLLAEKKKQEPALFDELRIVKLDEWQGLKMSDQGTCESYLRNQLLGPLGVTEDRYFAFRSDPEDPPKECRRIERVLGEQGPIDLCVLGLGVNGHLALNEPAEELTAEPHMAELSESSLQHPMIQHVAAPIRYGLTLGMSDIMRSGKILLLIQGAQKRAVVRRLLAGGISTNLPASLLRLRAGVTYLCHKDILTDEAS